ncbi:RidA family protein [Phenylobacterium sp.]|uniref:RidA family protein n=1 Tax=Phenylobacterium sp. TaxID=1871053 RepID=UPI002C1EA43D|nr:RidA family protein [Phenylobacterium sp.]HVI31364.1 RidA family protein [Phenylobacterium sp.]
MLKSVTAALALSLAVAGAAQAQNLHVNPTNGAISRAVKVPAGSEMLYVSGITPRPLNAGAPQGTPPQWADTKGQVASILGQIEEIMKAQGYGWEDVVMMRVLLVGDPAKGGRMDFAGMMEAYMAVYGPLKNRPARITSQVAALVQPGMLAEIEVQAAKKP